MPRAEPSPSLRVLLLGDVDTISSSSTSTTPRISSAGSGSSHNATPGRHHVASLSTLLLGALWGPMGRAALTPSNDVVADLCAADGTGEEVKTKEIYIILLLFNMIFCYITLLI